MKRLFIIVNLILLAAVSFYAVRIFYRLTLGNLAAEALPVSPPGAAMAVEQKKREQPVTDIQAILDRNLFKTDVQVAAEPAAAKPVDVEALEPTKLNLKLWGTVASPGGRAFAVIEDVKNRRQRLIRENDQIEDATVKKILRGKVILAVKGHDEVLEMEKIGTGSRRGGRPPSRMEGGGGEAPPEERVRVQQSEIESAVKNVNQLMKQVRIRPHFTNGKADGLRLTGIRSGSIFSRMGLRSGDILVGVDGERIQSVDDALKFYKSLKSASNVKLTVKRGGREKTIDYQVE